MEETFQLFGSKTKHMHLGFLTPEYPHDRVSSSAGIGSSIRNLALALVSKEINVSIFVYGQQEDAVLTEAGIKFHFIKQQKFRWAGWFLHRRYLQNYLNKFIAIDKIDAVEAPDWTGITAFMKLKCPLVIRMHGSDAYFCKLEKRPQKKKNFCFEKLALQGADKFLSVSEFTALQTTEIFNLKKQIKVIPNSVDTEFFSPSTRETDPNILLYFGSLIRKKGVLELSGIFNNVVDQRPSTKFLLLGKDVMDIRENRSTFELFKERLSPQAEKQVQFLNEVHYGEIREYLASATVVMLPSFAEALPMTWLEAMAMEKAVVTSNIGWAREVMVDGKTGYMEDPLNHTAYAEKILRLLEDRELKTKMQIAARETILEKFSNEVVVKKNIEFYSSLIKRK